MTLQPWILLGVTCLAAPAAHGERVITNGRIAFDDLHVAHVFSPVGGQVVEVLAMLGAAVRQGEPLMVLQSADFANAASELERDTAALRAADVALQGLRARFAQNGVTAAEVEAAEDARAGAQAALERARQRMQLLRSSGAVTGQRYTLRAPRDGEVLARTVPASGRVEAAYGDAPATELFAIGDLDTVWAVADVEAADLARVQPGQAVEASSEHRGEGKFSGVVDRVSPVLDSETRTGKIRCTIKNAEHRLRPGMLVTLKLR